MDREKLNQEVLEIVNLCEEKGFEYELSTDAITVTIGKFNYTSYYNEFLYNLNYNYIMTTSNLLKKIKKL